MLGVYSFCPKKTSLLLAFLKQSLQPLSAVFKEGSPHVLSFVFTDQVSCFQIPNLSQTSLMHCSGRVSHNAATPALSQTKQLRNFTLAFERAVHSNVIKARALHSTHTSLPASGRRCPVDSGGFGGATGGCFTGVIGCITGGVVVLGDPYPSPFLQQQASRKGRQ